MPEELNEQDWSARRAMIASDNQRRMITHLKNRTSDVAEGAMENDARVYTDPKRFEREMDVLFRDTPLVAGLSGDLPVAGSIMLFEELDQSILITRNKDGKVGAFLNMCTHRGAKLMEECAEKNRITCPFHGWSFDLDGQLAGLTAPETFANMDRSTRALIKVPCIEWNGIIFIKARPGDDAIDIVAHLGSFAPELAQLELQQSVPVKTGRLDADCNWKYALDTYGEGYHFPVLHRETVSLLSAPNTFYDPFGNHHRIGWALQSYKSLLDAPESEWPRAQFSAVHYLFPNTVIFYGAVTEGDVFVQIFRHFPDAVGKMHTNFSVYSPGEITDESYRADVEAGFDGTAHVVDTEDYWIARNGWARLRDAPAGFKVLYSANEIALQDNHKNIAAAIGMSLDVYART
ncbi:MAG: SRPBCC family protein [Pseudomonadales bacterium]